MILEGSAVGRVGRDFDWKGWNGLRLEGTPVGWDLGLGSRLEGLDPDGDPKGWTLIKRDVVYGRVGRDAG